MVADKVEVETKSQESNISYNWLSDGKSEYEVIEGSKPERGTILKLFIDEANKDLLTEWKLRELIKKYSNYVAYPIMLQVEKTLPQSPSNEGEASDSKQAE